MAFQFEIEVADEVPEAADLGNTNSLPFKALFSSMPHKGHLFVPVSFWTSPEDEGGRGAAKEDATVSWQKGKFRSQFREWKKADEEVRGSWVMILAPRVKGDVLPGNKIAQEAGMSVYLENLSEKAKPS